jgi:hypothetical protein
VIKQIFKFMRQVAVFTLDGDSAKLSTGFQVYRSKRSISNLGDMWKWGGSVKLSTGY